MGTAQRTVTTAAPAWPSGDPTYTANSAAASFVAGRLISHTHFNYLINAISQMNGHNHTWTDYYQQATYGNNGDRNNYSQTSTSNGPNNPAYVIGLHAAGDTILATDHNDCRTSVAALASHTHYENDRTS